VGDADHGIAVDLVPRGDQRLDGDVGVGADEIGRLRARRTLDLAGNDELLGVQIGKLGVLDDKLIAAAEIDDDVVVRLVRSVDNGLKRAEIEVANVDAVAGLQIRDGVDAGALADEERVVAAAAPTPFRGGAPSATPPAPPPGGGVPPPAPRTGASLPPPPNG